MGVDVLGDAGHVRRLGHGVDKGLGSRAVQVVFLEHDVVEAEFGDVLIRAQGDVDRGRIRQRAAVVGGDGHGEVIAGREVPALQHLEAVGRELALCAIDVGDLDRGIRSHGSFALLDHSGQRAGFGIVGHDHGDDHRGGVVGHIQVRALLLHDLVAVFAGLAVGHFPKGLDLLGLGSVHGSGRRHRRAAGEGADVEGEGLVLRPFAIADGLLHGDGGSGLSGRVGVHGLDLDGRFAVNFARIPVAGERRLITSGGCLLDLVVQAVGQVLGSSAVAMIQCKRRHAFHERHVAVGLAVRSVDIRGYSLVLRVFVQRHGEAEVLGLVSVVTRHPLGNRQFAKGIADVGDLYGDGGCLVDGHFAICRLEGGVGVVRGLAGELGDGDLCAVGQTIDGDLLVALDFHLGMAVGKGQVALGGLCANGILVGLVQCGHGIQRQGEGDARLGGVAVQHLAQLEATLRVAGVGVGHCGEGRLFRVAHNGAGSHAARLTVHGGGVAARAVVGLGHGVLRAVGQFLDGQGLVVLEVEGHGGLAVGVGGQLVACHNAGRCYGIFLVLLQALQGNREAERLGLVAGVARHGLADLEVAIGVPGIREHSHALVDIGRAGDAGRAFYPVMHLRYLVPAARGLHPVHQAGVGHFIVLAVALLRNGELGVQGQALNQHAHTAVLLKGIPVRLIDGGDLAGHRYFSLAVSERHTAIGAIRHFRIRSDGEFELVGLRNVVALQHLDDGQLGIAVAHIGDYGHSGGGDFAVFADFSRRAADLAGDGAAGQGLVIAVNDGRAVVSLRVVFLLHGVGHARGQAVHAQGLGLGDGDVASGDGLRPIGHHILGVYVSRAGNAVDEGQVEHMLAHAGLDGAVEGPVAQGDLHGEERLLVGVVAGDHLFHLQGAVALFGVGDGDGLGFIRDDGAGRFGVDGADIARVLCARQVLSHGVGGTGLDAGEGGGLATGQVDGHRYASEGLLGLAGDHILAAFGFLVEGDGDREYLGLVGLVAGHPLGHHQAAGLLGVGHHGLVVVGGLEVRRGHDGTLLAGVAGDVIVLVGLGLHDVVGQAHIQLFDGLGLAAVYGQLGYISRRVQLGRVGQRRCRIGQGKRDPGSSRIVPAPGGIHVDLDVEGIGFRAALPDLLDGQPAVLVDLVGHDHDGGLVACHAAIDDLLAAGIVGANLDGGGCHVRGVRGIAGHFGDGILHAVGQMLDHLGLVGIQAEPGHAVYEFNAVDVRGAVEVGVVQSHLDIEGLVGGGHVAGDLLLDLDVAEDVPGVGVVLLVDIVLAADDGVADGQAGRRRLLLVTRPGGIGARHGGGITLHGGLGDGVGHAVRQVLDDYVLVSLQRDLGLAGTVEGDAGDGLAIGGALGGIGATHGLVAVLQPDAELEGLVRLRRVAAHGLADLQVGIALLRVGEGVGGRAGLGDRAGFGCLAGSIAGRGLLFCG